jgi:lipoate---protein ligase
MIARKDFKVPEGKLLRVELELESGTVLRALVRGDFFAHPEEAFEAAEAELIGLPVDRLGEAALALFSRQPLRIFGASPTDIARALEAAASASPGEPGGRP